LKTANPLGQLGGFTFAIVINFADVLSCVGSEVRFLKLQRSAPEEKVMSRVLTDGNDDIAITVDLDVYALNGNDRVFGGVDSLASSWYGGKGNDALLYQQTAFVDLYGGSGNDTLHGGESIDSLYGEDGNDLIAGGQFDAVAAQNGGQIVLLDARSSIDYLDGGEGSDALYGFDSIDTLIGGDGDDTNILIMVASALTANTLMAVMGGLYGGDSTDFLDGGRGNDYLDGGPSFDTMIGGLGDDQFIVDHILDAIGEIEGQGNDRLFTSVSYTLSNGAEVELMTTTDHAGTQTINLTGNDLSNTIFGNAGDNILNGQGGVDDLLGLAGNDTYFVDNLNDRVNEAVGQGNDRVFASVSFNLTSGQEIERLQTTDNAGSQAINLRGNEFANFVAGNNGDNIVAGSAGNDTLLGLGGNDRFLFETSLNAATNVDQMGDFTVGSDLIMLASSVFTGLGTSHFLADANFLVVGSRGQDGDDRVLYDPSNGALHFDGDGNGAGAAVTFAFIQPGTNLHASDIFVV
jgi:Ca2+-binding RTX toxin-like protein